MSKKHIAFLNVPSPPHINPTLSIVSTLVKRGHRVTYVTSDRFEPTIAGIGAECVPCERFPRVEDFKEVVGEPHGEWNSWDEIGRGDQFFIEFASRALPQLRDRYERDVPDLILYDRLFPAGRVLAELWRIPAIQMSPEFAYHDVYFTRRNGVCYTPQGVAEFGRKLDIFFNDHGVRASNSLFHKEKLNIYFFPKVFQFNADTFDERFIFTGECTAARPSEDDWKPKSTDGKPLILVSASTTQYNGREYFRMLINALKDLPWGIVISTGDMDKLSSIGEIPENVELRRYLPYPKVFPHVWLNICQGGTSTIVESMCHGAALICISQNAEPAEYSHRVSELGVGIHIRQPELTCELLRQTVLGMAENASMRARAKQMQKIIQSEKMGPEDVVDIIERMLVRV